MTSASELFYTRRSRFGRNSDPFDVSSHSPVDRGSRRSRYPPSSHHHSTNTRRDRTDHDVCGPPRLVPHRSRQPHFHRSSHSLLDREFIRPELGGHQLASGNAIHSGSQSNVLDRVQFSGNDRLPGAVLLARDRLVQRLRGVTLPGSRQRNRNSQIDHRSETVIGDVLRLTDAEDGETDISRDWLATLTSVIDSISRLTSIKPPGLTQEALNSLRIEVFRVLEEGDKEDTSSKITECSICLESFLEGDELILLPCAHRYHVCCLDPWVRTCGECPYCRRGIIVNADGVEYVERSSCSC
ncbi:putative E3 ubiquitin-protein ligase RHY1A [Primulina tabacum]|uniref:putative E3 ubiquitin-protein ligase RHY1A n=1 Tax=Primulina tabacum TaxID=48773 RepID=UPI003F5ABA85